MVVQKANRAERDQESNSWRSDCRRDEWTVIAAATINCSALVKYASDFHSLVVLADDASIYGEFLASTVAAFI
jgi:hypothetical protein